MRLEPAQVATIKRLVRATYGERASIRLCGSQLDDRRRGGDIDLMVEIPPEAERPLASELDLRRHLSEALDDRKVDLVVHVAGREPHAIVRIARRDGVLL